MMNNKAVEAGFSKTIYKNEYFIQLSAHRLLAVCIIIEPGIIPGKKITRRDWFPTGFHTVKHGLKQTIFL